MFSRKQNGNIWIGFDEKMEINHTPNNQFELLSLKHFM
jgi:hypothetical protein